MARLLPPTSVFGAVAASLLTLFAACARPLAFHPLGPATAAQPTRDHARDVVTRQELATVNDLTVYDAIVRLRPQYLHCRGGYCPKIYVDDLPYGDIASLRDLRANGIAEIQHLDAMTATTRFGTGQTGGAILVFTFREPRTR
jgi:hypothetical protein